MRLAHKNNAKSREHAHTCRKARAICKLRYKNKINKFVFCEIDVSQLPEGLTELGAAHNRLVGSLCLTSLPQALDYLHLENNAFHGSLGFTRLPESLESLDLSDNLFSGEIDVSYLPAEMRELDVRNNKLCGNVHTPPGLVCWVDDTENNRLFNGNADLGVEDLGIYCD
ncbi:leucine-rich repeat protein [Perkinsela sp. CCAP 1560/4]|nr:leucine-rich repeat protein [Perkinsela sp. CCAP 1560/4]|eukprot:KNH06048.1 leucine-rich repeat protein [Perkinsela sp. CCAP 1560/4]